MSQKSAQCLKMSLLKILNKCLSCGENISHMLRNPCCPFPLSPLKSNEILLSQTPHVPLTHNPQSTTEYSTSVSAQVANIIQNFVEEMR